MYRVHDIHISVWDLGEKLYSRSIYFKVVFYFAVETG